MKCLFSKLDALNLLTKTEIDCLIESNNPFLLCGFIILLVSYGEPPPCSDRLPQGRESEKRLSNCNCLQMCFLQKNRKKCKSCFFWAKSVVITVFVWLPVENISDRLFIGWIN